MKIVIYSPAFYPMIGGLETVVQTLAEEWSRLGNVVTVVTNAENAVTDSFRFKVLRCATFFEVVRAVRECDVFVHANVSLWGLLPWLLCGTRRPAWVATHHGWYFLLDKRVGLRSLLKISLMRLASANISVSAAVNRHLGSPGVVIPNPYNNHTFSIQPDVRRGEDLVFLGRLVSEKGCDLVLDALALLGLRGLRPRLTVVGSGPEDEHLRQQVEVLGLTKQVTFVGAKHAHELPQILNAHRIMVIPSRCHEGFGIVALEGIACGCVIVGANSGGLPEAVGPCGVIFPLGNCEALASRLEYLLTNVHACQNMLVHASAHLALHAPEQIAKRYLDVFRQALCSLGGVC